MKLLITGASGLIGTGIARLCFERGHEICILARNPKRAWSALSIPCHAFPWDSSAAAPVPEQALLGADVVLNLAGEPLATGAWTAAKKKRMVDSRIRGTRALVASIRNMPRDARPAALISASAVGYYGNRRDKILREDSSPGDARQDFLARICTEWENEVFGQPIEGVRMVAVRLGVVLARGGGALETMLPAFNLGAGAVIGSGNQWMSWIHIDDALEALYFLLENSSIQDAVNLTSPNPATNRKFTRALAGALSRPALFRVPGFGLKLAFGEKSSMLLASQRAIPARLQSLGFRFRYEQIGEALNDLCSANRFEAAQWVPRDVNEVFPFFSDARNIERITPPWLSFHVLGSIGAEMREGTHIQYRLKLHGLPMKWRTRIEKWEPGKMFRDIQIEGPYSRWEHEHRFIAVAGGTLIRDSVRYNLPFGAFGEALAGHWVAKDVRAIFAYRRKAIEEIFRKAGTAK